MRGISDASACHDGIRRPATAPRLSRRHGRLRPQRPAGREEQGQRWCLWPLQISLCQTEPARSRVRSVPSSPPLSMPRSGRARAEATEDCWVRAGSP